jgi:hypothetical protein
MTSTLLHSFRTHLAVFRSIALQDASVIAVNMLAQTHAVRYRTCVRICRETPPLHAHTFSTVRSTRSSAISTRIGSRFAVRTGNRTSGKYSSPGFTVASLITTRLNARVLCPMGLGGSIYVSRLVMARTTTDDLQVDLCSMIS